MDHDSNSRDSCDGLRSSTVISVAQRVAPFSSIVDELVLRVYSLMRFEGETSISIDVCNVNLAEIGATLVLEADAWWNDHGLSQVGFEQKRGLIRELLSRSPIDGALMLLGVFARERFQLLESEDIDVIHSWCVQLGSSHRKLVLALAGVLMARWYSERHENEFQNYLVQQFELVRPPEFNPALAVCLGVLQNGTLDDARLIMAVLVRVQQQVELARSEQLGSLLAKLWEFLPVEVESWLSERSHLIARKVFRLAVERMPSHVRSGLTQRWKARRVREQDNGP